MKERVCAGSVDISSSVFCVLRILAGDWGARSQAEKGAAGAMFSGGGRPIRVLNVAEKPSVAKSVAEILSRRGGGFLRSREGRSRYNRVFEFDYTIRGQACHMLMTSVTGHLMELDFDERYRRWHSCDPADLYNAPVRKYVPQVSFPSILLCVLSRSHSAV